MKKKIVRSLSFIMAMVMIFSISYTSAFAAEANETDGLVPIENDGITREEAMSALGLTEEEAENVKFYTQFIDGENSGTPYGNALGWGVHDLGTFTFSDYNLGAYRTYNGTKVKITVQFTNNMDYACNLRVLFKQYGGKEFGNLFCWNSGTYESDWININYGVDYLFEYFLAVSGSGIEDPNWPKPDRRTSGTVRVLVGVHSPY